MIIDQKGGTTYPDLVGRANLALRDPFVKRLEDDTAKNNSLEAFFLENNGELPTAMERLDIAARAEEVLNLLPSRRRESREYANQFFDRKNRLA